ncbi:MAG: aromatic ring-hydroxylating dioxygenase subunit alpha [Pseudomonadota bacterium]
MTMPGHRDLLPGGLDADPGRSYTMASRYYIDPDVLVLEQDRIFARSWFFVGHESRLAEPGAYMAVDFADEGIMLVRGRDGVLRAFYNVCQHRAHRLVEGEGNLKLTMTCPYHAWAYDLEGKLRTARGCENVDGFDKAEFGLKPVRVETMLGLVFVNLDPDAPALKEQYTGLEEEILNYTPRAGQLAFACHKEYDLQANWKVVIDNFQECYHCEPAHPAFVDLVEMPTYRNRVHDYWSCQTSDKPHARDSSAYSFEPGDVDFGYAGFFVWPNLTIWLMPGEPNLMTLQMLPDGPERCHERLDWHSLGGATTQQAADAIAYIDDILQPEDIALCESVFKGLKSRGYDRGRFIVDRDRSHISEHAVHHFHTLVMEALEGKTPAPQREAAE